MKQSDDKLLQHQKCENEKSKSKWNDNNALNKIGNYSTLKNYYIIKSTFKWQVITVQQMWKWKQ